MTQHDEAGFGQGDIRRRRAGACSSARAPALAQEIVLIPNRVIYPGETIDLAALKEVTLKPGKVIPPAVAFRAPEIEGKVAKRTLLPGRYIPATFAARSLARRTGRLGAGHVRRPARSPSRRPP